MAASVTLEPHDSPEHPMAPWFALARGERAARRRSGPPRRRAIITMVHDEGVFLPVWLAHYGRYFAAQDIYVLDNDSADGSTDRPGFTRIPAPHDTVDHAWMVARVQALQHELLDSYELVVVSDVDELIAPTPTRGTLGDYLDGFDEEWVNCLGYELLHDRAHEPPLDLTRPILGQRGTWFVNGGYDKPAVATVGLQWRPGFHGRTDHAMRPDPDLRLIHLHRMDYDLCLARHRVRARRAWAELDATQGWASHNRIVDEAAFARWFDTDSSFPGFAIRPEAIDPIWHGVL